MASASSDIVTIINKVVTMVIIIYHVTSHDCIQLPLSTSNILKELDKKQLLMADKPAGYKKSKRLKLDTPIEDKISLDKSWQRVGIILDAVPGCISPQESHQLVPTLFELLEGYGIEIVL